MLYLRTMFAALAAIALASGCDRHSPGSSAATDDVADTSEISIRSSDTAHADASTDLPSDTIETDDAPNVDVGDSDFDPSRDPGVDPVFTSDPFFARDDPYEVRETRPGDHDLPPDIVPIPYDVTGTDDLQTVLTDYLDALQQARGIALYLINGNELDAADLDFLQHLNAEHTGWPGLSNLDTLHVYNLTRLPPGIESTDDSEVAYGNPHPYLWRNGWQGPDSEIMKGDGGWVKHLVMDDLEEIPAGAFCDTMFESVSFKNAKVVRTMAFGFRPRAKMDALYLPNVEHIEQHAFRRNQKLHKVYLPRVTVIEDFAFDDNSELEYFSAPQLETIGRNALNDTHALRAVHLPQLTDVGINCFDMNYAMTVLRLPEVRIVRNNGLEGFEALVFAYLPKVENLTSRALINCTALQAVYLGTTPPLQGSDVFTATPEDLTIYHTGDDPGWDTWIPSGNPSAAVVGL